MSRAPKWSKPVDPTMAILIVDDQQSMIDVMSAIAWRLGFADVDSAHDGMAALAMLHEKPYGLVISDVQMEPYGGLSLLRHVRADDRLKDVRVLLTTASMDGSFVVAAKLAKVDGYLLKPFTPGQLQEKIEAIL
jgi:two-component system chemotaxis response regulator CheY